jgi:hypothetical protein
MATAIITNQGHEVFVKSPYNASLVSDIKALQGRRWDGGNKVWAVPARLESEVREIVRRYFQIEGEESTIEYETVRVHVEVKSSSKRSYIGNVTVDGHDIVSGLYGNVRRNDDAFEVIEEKGGFTRGDSRHAFEVSYDLVLKVRKGAIFQSTGHADYWGRFSFIEEAPAKVRKPRVKYVSPLVAQLQIAEGKKARLVNGKIVIK